MAKIKLNSSRPVGGKMQSSGTVLTVGVDVSGQEARDLVGRNWAEIEGGAPGIVNGDPAVSETRGARAGKGGKNAD